MTDSPWLWEGEPYEPEEGHLAFVYRIVRLDTGRSYVGKKLLTRAVTRPPLKGKVRKRRSRAESDWRSYWGSNEELRDEVVLLGEKAFRREVVRPCRSKTEATYYEAKLQLELDVLLHTERFYNSFVGCKIHRTHTRSFSES